MREYGNNGPFRIAAWTPPLCKLAMGSERIAPMPVQCRLSGRMLLLGSSSGAQWSRNGLI